MKSVIIILSAASVWGVIITLEMIFPDIGEGFLGFIGIVLFALVWQGSSRFFDRKVKEATLAWFKKIEEERRSVQQAIITDSRKRS